MLFYGYFGFFGGSNVKVKTSPLLHGSLHQQVIELAHCNNPSQYESELQKVIPLNNIIRWYIIGMTADKVRVEVVIENKGVGNS